MNNNRGITLIALIISILVMLILAGVSISGVLNADTIGRAKEVAFKSEAKDIKDAWETKIIGIDSTYLDYEDISKILSDSNANPDMLKKLEIQNGRLVYKSEECTEEEIRWFESLGIFGGLSIVASVKTNVKVLEEDIKTEIQQAMDVILVLDTSGSMSSKDNGEIRAKKMTDVINDTMKSILEVNEDNRVGIVNFASNVNEFIPLDHYEYSGGQDSIFLKYYDETFFLDPTIKTYEKNNNKIAFIKDSKGVDVKESINITGRNIYSVRNAKSI